MNNSSSEAVGSNQPGQLLYSYQEQRTKFLKILLWGASAIGFFVVIFCLVHTTPALTAVILAAYLLLLMATFVPIPYQLRAGILFNNNFYTWPKRTF